MAEEPPGMRARLAVVLDRDLAVHEHEAIAARPLHAPPLAAPQVVHDPGRERARVLEVVDADVRRRALDERAAVAEARTVGGQRREPPVRVLERAHLLLAHDAAQKLRRVATAGEELRVRAAV